jgi:hypothetical protein
MHRVVLRCCAALFAVATVAYPRAFRQRFGRAMADAFLDGVSDRGATRGWAAALLFAGRSIANLIGSGLAERQQSRRRSAGRDTAREPVRVLLQDLKFALRMMRRSICRIRTVSSWPTRRRTARRRS